jgi:hypothetical protein
MLLNRAKIYRPWHVLFLYWLYNYQKFAGVIKDECYVS